MAILHAGYSLKGFTPSQKLAPKTHSRPTTTLIRVLFDYDIPCDLRLSLSHHITHADLCEDFAITRKNRIFLLVVLEDLETFLRVQGKIEAHAILKEKE